MAYTKSPLKANFIEILGSAVRYTLDAFRYIFKFKIDAEKFVGQLVFIGYECMPMIVILTSISSMILTVNTAIELTHQGGRELVGALIALADLREIVPIFIAFAIAARCGTALTAEISSMKVTEQIDALRVLKVNPVYYLMAPTIISVILLAPFLLALASLISIFSGMMVAKFVVNLEFTQFLDSAWNVVTLEEYFYPLIKTEIFAIYAMAINITMGLDCVGGAKEVGLTTTRATALVIVGIVILDGFLTPILHG